MEEGIKKGEKNLQKNKTFFAKPLAFSEKMCYNTTVRKTRPVGQAAKTSPSHGENMGSIPVRVTNKSTPNGVLFCFICSTRHSAI